MISSTRRSAVCLFVFVVSILQAAPPVPAVTILIQTELGDIEAELDPAHAPVTTANFLRYVDAGLYEEGLIHRTVRPDNQPNSPIKIEVIQGGRDPKKKGFEAVPLERTSITGLRHRDGTLSMARSGVDTATSDFFICIGDQPSLDLGGLRNPDGQGFAAFGQVTKGMDLVRKIQARAADEKQKLTPPVRILNVVRVKR